MKKLCAVAVLFLAAGVVLGRLWQEDPVAVAGNNCLPLLAEDGYVAQDVNGGGSVDLSDVLYILNWLFLNGPPPITPCEFSELQNCQRELSERGCIAATGQTECYGDTPNGPPIPCGFPYPGQDAVYQAGCPMFSRFVDNNDGTVSDNCTGLMWAKSTLDLDGDGFRGPNDRRSWQDALQLCATLNLAGHGGWRLPNVKELQSIIDYGTQAPAVRAPFAIPNLDGFDRPWGEHWTSTTSVYDAGEAWLVSLSYGVVQVYFYDPVQAAQGRSDKLDHFYVLPVRTE